jgi:hypothetical protein
MTKNCNAKIGSEQKILLKILNCLWNQYVNGRTPKTVAYLAAPSEAGFNEMKDELDAIQVLIAGTKLITKLQDLITGVSTANVFSGLASVYANGAVAYSTTSIVLLTYIESVDNYASKTIEFDNKLTNQLNVYELQQTAEQVAPETSQNPENSPVDPETTPLTWVTAATIAGRSGCSGVSNTGFISLRIEANLASFPFKTCEYSDPYCCV